MKYIIFAGGYGTRFWPMSKKSKPKQFVKIFEGKSTLELTVDRIKPITNSQNIFISTNENYKNLVKQQTNLPDKQLIIEPGRRDLEGAIGYALFYLKKNNVKGPIAILWADHLMKNVKVFQNALIESEKLIIENPNQIIFLGEKPRFTNHNIGWLELGDKINIKSRFEIYKFKKLRGKPTVKNCEKMFRSKNFLWNPGYFITSIEFLEKLYKRETPKTYNILKAIFNEPNKTLQKELYSTLAKNSFDKAILERLKNEEAKIIKVNMHWSDAGTFYAFKEAIKPKGNLFIGNNVTFNLKNSLIINKEKDKLVCAINLKNIMIINTPEALLVLKNSDADKIKDLVKKIEQKKLSKYL